MKGREIPYLKSVAIKLFLLALATTIGILVPQVKKFKNLSIIVRKINFRFLLCSVYLGPHVASSIVLWFPFTHMWKLWVFFGDYRSFDLILGSQLAAFKRFSLYTLMASMIAISLCSIGATVESLLWKLLTFADHPNNACAVNLAMMDRNHLQGSVNFCTIENDGIQTNTIIHRRHHWKFARAEQVIANPKLHAYLDSFCSTWPVVVSAASFCIK